MERQVLPVGITVVSCRHTSLEELMGVYQEVWATSPVYRERFCDDQAKAAIECLTDCWVALAGDAVAGFVGGYPLIQDAEPLSRSLVENLETAYWIAELGVLPEYQNRGVGGCLFDLLISTKIADGFEEFLLCTAQGNLSAMCLYESRGFRLIRKADGPPVKRSVTKMRTNGIERTDQRIFYHLWEPKYVPG
jgi:ribosomal protein S18 acetylase RimI-like enzyme